VRYRAREPGIFVGERKQGIAFGTAKLAARVLAEKENDKGEDQTKADRKRERDDRHNARGS
jgi:hypothetical protein